VTPLISLEIVEAPSQEELPYWDILDRKLQRRTLRYGLTNTFTSRTPRFRPDGTLLRNDYRQLLKIGIYSSYEFASNYDWAERTWARYYTTGYFERGMGPVEFEIETSLFPGMSARLLSSLDSRTGQFTRHEISMALRDRRSDTLRLTYDYDNPTLSQGPNPANTISQIRGDLGLNLTRGWSALLMTRYDFIKKRELESSVTLKYNSQCYGISFIYYSTYNDKRIGMVFDLLGLGSFGTPSTSLVSSSDR
jgi:hypothetical protein